MGKKIEVDEEQLLFDTKLRNTVASMMKHPKAKLLVQEAHKMVDPEAITPDLDNAKIAQEPVKQLAEKFDAFVAETKKDKEEREKAEKLAKLNDNFENGRKMLKAQKWTEDGIKKLEEFMEQNGIINHEVAAAAFEKLHPPATPVVPSSTGSWNFLELQPDGDADLKKLIESKGENSSLLDKMANDAISEVRGQPRR